MKNPIILGALAPISHASIEKQVEFYKTAEKSGVGAIIPGSFLPFNWDHETIQFTQNDAISLFGGSGNHARSNKIGFAILGPPSPNLRQIQYGRMLIQQMKKNIHVPIIGSIANFGTEALFIKAAEMLANEGVDALELNFSCPNIIDLEKLKTEHSESFKVVPMSLNLIKKIKQITGLPISIKLAPNQEFYTLLQQNQAQEISCIDGITCFNAYGGLTPPSLKYPFGGQFGRSPEWSYSGVYGSFVRFFTYKALAEFKTNPAFKKIQMSAIGGFTQPDHIIEALLLGADTTQFASGILLKSADLIASSVKRIKSFMRKNHFKTIDDFRGISLRYLATHVSNIPEYQAFSEEPPHRPLSQRHISERTDKCNHCNKCIQRCCLATQKREDGKVIVLNDLCSGCGWCKIICPIKGAIK